MPFYDYIYNTVDRSSDDLYERKLKGEEEALDVVHLTHLTALQSIYHLRLGFPSLASKPYKSKWYMLTLWPISWVSMVLAWLYGSPLTVERNILKKLRMQTWAIPRYNFQVRSFIHNMQQVLLSQSMVIKCAPIVYLCSMAYHGRDWQSMI